MRHLYFVIICSLFINLISGCTAPTPPYQSAEQEISTISGASEQNYPCGQEQSFTCSSNEGNGNLANPEFPVCLEDLELPIAYEVTTIPGANNDFPFQLEVVVDMLNNLLEELGLWGEDSLISFTYCNVAQIDISYYYVFMDKDQNCGTQTFYYVNVYTGEVYTLVDDGLLSCNSYKLLGSLEQ